MKIFMIFLFLNRRMWSVDLTSSYKLDVSNETKSFSNETFHDTNSMIMNKRMYGIPDTVIDQILIGK